MSNEEQIKELNDRLNRMIEEKYNLCCECERLNTELQSNEKIINKLIKEVDTYKEVCEEIEELIKEEDWLILAK